MEFCTDSILIPDTLPAKGDLMGIVYDDKAQAWKLDLPCRVAGKRNPTHLKDTVHGPKRATQAKAMQRWLELNTIAKNPVGSLKFGEDCEKYLKENPRLKQGVRSVVNHLKSGLGHVKRSDFKEEFKKWIEVQEKRNVMKWRKVDGVLTLCDTGKQIAKATIQSYKRYAKLLAKGDGYGEAIKEIKIGKRVIRKRPIETWEILKLEEVIQEHYSWFYPIFDFARTNPIRPEDQFSITVEKHLKGDKLVYAPIKTFEETGLMAYPIIWEHQRAYFDNLVSGLIFCRPDGQTLMESDNSRYYDFIWGKILKKAGISNLRFYDLRHHAVAFMRSRGIEDWRIMKAAGWSSIEMISDYDPDNVQMIDEYDKSIVGVVKCSTESRCSNTEGLIIKGESDVTY